MRAPRARRSTSGATVADGSCEVSRPKATGIEACGLDPKTALQLSSPGWSCTVNASRRAFTPPRPATPVRGVSTRARSVSANRLVCVHDRIVGRSVRCRKAPEILGRWGGPQRFQRDRVAAASARPAAHAGSMRPMAEGEPNLLAAKKHPPGCGPSIPFRVELSRKRS